ncbi:MAG: oligosaccharyl transferase, archaeosortase A system-associated [Halodesulfurarchaeum sp.]
MSEEAASDVDRGASQSSLLNFVRDWYPVPALVAIVAVMFWIRIQSRKNFFQNGQVYFSGNDPWYHFRQVAYTVHHWPSTMPFDPWTGFATGISVGQFGTLFDQIIATGALIYGLGSPTTQQIATTVLYAPPVFGALVAIPTYLIGKRLGGRLAGLFGAIILALFSGTFLQRGMVAFADHNIAEPLFQGFAVLALMIAVTVSVRERPIWEQVLERDYVGLEPVVVWSALAGIAVALYMWVWPPGILLVGIFGVFLLVKMTSDYFNGESPEHVAFAGAISMGVTGLLMLIPFASTSWSTTNFSLLQPVFSFGVAAGAVFLAWLAREWESRDLTDQYYPLAVLGILAVAVVLARFLLPGLFNLITSNLLRFVGFDAGAQFRTIGEAQPFPSSRANRLGLSGITVIFMEYGAAFFTAMIGGVWMLVRPHLASGDTRQFALAGAWAVTTIVFLAFPALPNAIGSIFLINGSLVGVIVVGAFLAALAVTGAYRAERLLVLTWSVFILAAAFTQVRFNYYLVVPVAVLNAYLLREVIDFLGLDIARAQLEDVEFSHALAIATVLIVVIAPLVAPISFTNQYGQTVPMSTAWESAENQGPGAITRWDPTLEWMQNNTPAVGDYGNTNNADMLDYYGTYAQPPDGNFNYPPGSYGVMSWWDYGHWITTEGHRIPVANPFQQHATVAANYLLAPNETAANNVLESIDENDSKTRYVAVDWKMVAPQSKFGAPIVFYERNESLSYRDMILGQIYGRNRQTVITLKSQRYYESMMVRLYRYHGSARQAQPVVVDFKESPQVKAYVYNGTRQFRSMQAARQYVKRDPTSMIGGISDYPKSDVKALEHYRLVKTSNQYLAPTRYLQNGEFNYNNFPTWVKLFERVPGATVHGTAPPNTTVTARVEMAIPFPRKPGTFNYTQYAKTGPDGEFTMTLPYSTTGYQNWGPSKGYTNVSVRATGPYTFSTPATLGENMTIVRWDANVSVPEAKVIGEDPKPIQVSLDRHVLDTIDIGGNETSGNETGDNETTSNETTNNETAGTVTNETGSTGAGTNTTTDGTSSDTGGNAGSNTTATDGSEAIAPVRSRDRRVPLEAAAR